MASSRGNAPASTQRAAGALGGQGGIPPPTPPRHPPHGGDERDLKPVDPGNKSGPATEGQNPHAVVWPSRHRSSHGGNAQGQAKARPETRGDGEEEGAQNLVLVAPEILPGSQALRQLILWLAQLPLVPVQNTGKLTWRSMDAVTSPSRDSPDTVHRQIRWPRRFIQNFGGGCRRQGSVSNVPYSCVARKNNIRSRAFPGLGSRIYFSFVSKPIHEIKTSYSAATIFL